MVPIFRLCDPDDLYFLSTTPECEKLAIIALCGGRPNLDRSWQLVQRIALHSGKRPFNVLRTTAGSGLLIEWLQELQLDDEHILAGLAHAARLQTKWNWKSLHRHCNRAACSLLAIYTDITVEMAVLDAPILDGLCRAFPDSQVPLRTPEDHQEYGRVEQLFLQLCHIEELLPWEMDRKLWQQHGVVHIWQEEHTSG